MVNRLEQTQGVLRHKVVKRTVFSVFSNTILNVGFALGYLVAFLWAAVRMSANSLSFGGMTAFLQLVNRIQNIRKSRDYEITARINVAIAPSALTDDTVAEYGEYIGRQVLAQAVVVAPVENPLDDERLDIDGTEVTVKVTLA